MLNAYRRSTVGVVLTVNGSLKPRLFTTAITLCSTPIEPSFTIRQGGPSTAQKDGQSRLAKGEHKGRPSESHLHIRKSISRLPRSQKRPYSLEFMTKFKSSLSDSEDTAPLATYSPETLNTSVEGDFTISGFIGVPRKVGARLFAPLTQNGCTVQLVCSQLEHPTAFAALLAITPNSAVQITGHLQQKVLKKPKEGEAPTSVSPLEQVEIVVQELKCFAEFPCNIIVGENAKYGPEQRHLQLRFEEDLGQRIRFRSRMTKKAHELLGDFTQVDTPILFKSTPEGAREFLVPTRNAGMAYALPQSPQQYKQILMASGIDKYYQMAHCFRDEDLRADRQPEFMQLDLEMAFCRGEDVRRRVEKLVSGLWKAACEDSYGKQIQMHELPADEFPTMTYINAMLRFGVDKPDLRIKDEITQVKIPETLQKMMTSINYPQIDTFKFNLSASPDEVRAFVAEIMDSPEFRPFHSNPDGPPGVFIYDPSKPLQGLHAFGHDGFDDIEKHFGKVEKGKRAHVVVAERKRVACLQRRLQRATEDMSDEGSLDDQIKEAQQALEAKPNGRHQQKVVDGLQTTKAAVELLERQLAEAVKAHEDAIATLKAPRESFAPGDLIIMQPRRNWFGGGSTPTGRLHTLLHRAAVEKGYMTMPAGFEPLWVIDFPLFTPTNDVDPGQGGSAGFSATHHPFTSPKTPRDVDFCQKRPHKALADHYDLVINGVELGGGSARIHDAKMQEFVLRDVIQMRPERVEDFRHLLEALRAGCPPHAGLALGWDRLVALMCGRESIRDVLAFPKDGKGRDVAVGSPSVMTRAQLKTYHLSVDKV